MHNPALAASLATFAGATPDPDGDAPQRLWVVGTAGGAWRSLAQDIAAGTGARCPVEVLANSVPAPSAAAAGTHLLVFVEDPSLALARRIGDLGEGDMNAALSTWRDSAQRLLRWLHAQPGRCQMVDLQEAQATPDALAAALARWVPGLQQRPPTPSGSADPLQTLIARHFVAADRSTVRLFEELRASCLVLEGAALEDPAGPAALARYWQLARAEQQLGPAQALAARAPVLEQQLARRDAELGQAQDDAAQTVQQLHLVQAELEAVIDRHEQVQRELDSLRVGQTAQAQREQALREAETHARQQVSELQRRLLSLQAEHEAVRARLQAEHEAALVHTQSQLQASSACLSESESALAKVRREEVLLLTQLHQVQEELEQLFVHTRGRDAADTAGPFRPADAAQVEIVGCHDEGSHRQVVFDLRGLSAAGRVIERLRVRLVEHVGRPGLLLETSGRPVQGILAWAPTGQEGDRPYMLFVPSDDSGRALLNGLGRTDWELVCSLAALLKDQVAKVGEQLAPRWATVAQRLCLELTVMPARLRYDGVQVVWAGDADLPTLDLRLERPAFGIRPLDVHLRWTPPTARGRAPQHVLHWLAADNAAAPPALAGWPIDADARLKPAFEIPVGPGQPAAWRRRQWSALAATDRELLLGVVESLAGSAGRAPDRPESSAGERQVIVAAAEALNRDARKALSVLRLHALVRPLVRRLLRRPAPVR